jgi:hypothetical protein
MKKKHKFFISHSSKDQDTVLSLIDDVLTQCLQLGQSDIYCTSRQGEIDAGKDFLQDISSNLGDDCRTVMLVLSNNFFESPFCMAELGASWMLRRQGRIKIIPLMMPQTDRKIFERTPLKNLQVCSLDVQEDLMGLIDNISRTKTKSSKKDLVTSSARINSAVSKFIEKLVLPTSDGNVE